MERREQLGEEGSPQPNHSLKAQKENLEGKEKKEEGREERAVERERRICEFLCFVLL